MSPRVETGVDPAQGVDIAISDTSMTPVPTYKLSPAAATANEGSNAVFLLQTANVPAGKLAIGVPARITGDAPPRSS